MKFKSIIERVPVDDMGNVEIGCCTVWGRSFTYYSPKITLTNENEALAYIKMLSKEKNRKRAG